MRSLFLLAAAALLAASPAALAAQQNLEDLKVGDRLRVKGIEPTLKGDRLYRLAGRLVGGDSAHLHVLRDSSAIVDTLPLFAVASVDVYRGNISRSKLVGASTGTGALMGIGAWAIVQVFKSADGSDTWKSLDRPTQIGIPVLTVAGFIFGKLASTESWVSVRVPPPRLPGPR